MRPVGLGGAYAVFPYIYQAAVEDYQWLTPTHMIDGLALGETTPGPLIMVVAFGGFVAAWLKEVFGPDARIAAPEDRVLSQFRELAATVGRLFELKDEARVRERTAAELIREEWRHALTLEAGKVGSWVWDVRTKTITCNDILRRM